MDIAEVSLALHCTNVTMVFKQEMKKESISGIPVAFGVYTPYKEDAREAASWFGGSIRHDEGCGSKYPHFHGIMSEYENLHFWYSPYMR